MKKSNIIVMMGALFISGCALDDLPSDSPLLNLSSPEESKVTEPEDYILLKSVLPWINELVKEDIIYLKKSFEFVGVAPGNTISNHYSNDEEDILTFLSYLDSATVALDSSIVGGIVGGYSDSCLIKTETSNYIITNRFGYIESDGMFYKLTQELPDLSNTYMDSYAFITTFNQQADLYLNEELIGDYAGIASTFEFKYVQEFDMQSTGYVLTTSFADLQIYDSKHFSFSRFVGETKYCEIVGDIDFSFIFSVAD